MVVMTYYTLYTMNFEYREVWKGKDVEGLIVMWFQENGIDSTW